MNREVLKARLRRAWKIIRGWNPVEEDREEFEKPIKGPETRGEMIKELLRLYADHPVVCAALYKLTEDSVEAGWNASIKNAFRDEVGYRAERVLERFEERTKIKSLASSFTFSAVGLGDSFLQPVADELGIAELWDMPAELMRRNSDERDRFPDSEKAFIYEKEGKKIYLHEGQILHWKWRPRGNQRYGSPLLFAGRTLGKESLEALRSLLPRRQANMPFRHFDVVGRGGNGLSQTIFNNLKKNISRLFHIQKGGRVSPFDDLFTSGVKLNVLGGDAQQGELRDIEAMLDAVLCLTGHSRQLLGWNTTGNRYTLDELRREAYAMQRKVAKGFLRNQLEPLYKLELALQDPPILPSQVTLKIEFAEQYTETETERRISASREDYRAGLITLEEAREIRSTYYGLKKISQGTEQLKQSKSLNLQQ